ncbi:MAG: hypothetical protein ACRCUY_08610 [Thermoguttaceae bacterium]
MTTLDWIKPIPGWDMLKWKDETQAEILRETAGMTGEEVREYFRKGAERFDNEMELRREELSKKETA